ncbi:MAG: HAD family hydrolase [Patescibacteria group bacterium]|jgi:phosphoglycolate phosphatase-like HAD superfamily hydrolase
MRNERKFEIGLIDWNGTLQNDLGHIYECGVQRIFRHFKLPCPSLDDYRNEVTADFMTSFYWPRGIPAEISAADLNAIMSEGFKAKGVPAGVFADALGTMRKLRRRGYPLVLVSGYDSRKLAEAVARHGFTDLFEEVIGDARDKPAVFADLLRKRGLSGSAAAVVGDTIEDAAAAAAIGAVPFICPRGFHAIERILPLLIVVPNLVIVDDLRHLLPFFP